MRRYGCRLALREGSRKKEAAARGLNLRGRLEYASFMLGLWPQLVNTESSDSHVNYSRLLAQRTIEDSARSGQESDDDLQ
jgi:hypothetical protein